MTSDTPVLRVALVVEGPTDYAILQALVETLAHPRAVTFSYIQPEFSAAFEPMSNEGGWGGVYRWCRSAVDLHGPRRLEDNLLFLNHDLLIVQIDADVAGCRYSDAHIDEVVQDLPCAMPCPPVDDTINALTSVIWRWLAINHTPDNTVLCIPAQNLEAWILAGLYPTDRKVTNGTIECRAKPERLLAAKPLDGRLVSGGKKNLAQYRARAREFAQHWQEVVQVCSQARTFEHRVLEAMS